jgi:translation initiation factor IF-1
LIFAKLKNYQMDNKKISQKTGIIIEALPSLSFKVKFDDGQEVIAHLAGKLRINRIRVMPGDKVLVELNSYDNKRGRIVYRLK